MTKKPSSKTPETGQRSSVSERRKRMAAAMLMLLALPRDELGLVLSVVFDRARLDEQKNVIRDEGIYRAACVAMRALLFGPAPSDHPDWAMVERLAAVGRGARLQTNDQVTANRIRALAPLLDADWSAMPAGHFVRTLEKHVGGPVNADGAERALRAGGPRRINGRVTWAALAAGVLPGVDEALLEPSGAAWREALDKVRDALKTKDVVP